jgi:hypothetical protein
MTSDVGGNHLPESLSLPPSQSHKATFPIFNPLSPDNRVCFCILCNRTGSTGSRAQARCKLGIACLPTTLALTLVMPIYP